MYYVQCLQTKVTWPRFPSNVKYVVVIATKSKYIGCPSLVTGQVAKTIDRQKPWENNTYLYLLEFSQL